MLQDKKTSTNLTTHLTKPKLLKHLAKNTNLSISTVDKLLKELFNTIKCHIKPNGPEKFILPGIFKITIKNIPPQEEKIGINPFTKEQITYKAKPATRKIKIKILKKIKDLANEPK